MTTKQPNGIEPTPKLLTNQKLLAVFFVQLNEAYQMSVLLPIVVFMCRDFGIQPQWLGVYSSLLNASFGFSQFLVAFLWGTLSDKYGRRMILLLGLFGTFLSMIMFGLSTSLEMAMIARILTGLFNGNLGVVKAYLADITDSSNRGYAFSVIGVSFGAGIILGSMLGGILVDTHDVDLDDEAYIHTTSVLKWSIFESQFPFLLPTGICGGVIAINALIWTLIFIKDENKIKNKTRTQYYNNNEIDDNISVDTIEMHSNLSANFNFSNTNNAYIALHDLQNQSLPSTADMKAMVTRLEPDRLKLLSNIRESRVKDDFDGDYAGINIETTADLFKHTKLGHSLLCYGIAAISFMMFKEMGPVFMAQALLFDSTFIGYTQAVAGVVLFIFTLFIQPYCLKKYNHRSMSMYCAVITGIATLLMPSCYWFTLVKSDKYSFMTDSIWLLSMVFVVELIITCSVSIVFVVSTCWLNNSVPNTHVGKANGIGQTMASFVRGFGPLMTGFIWSESFQQIDNDNIHYAIYYAYIPGAILYFVSTFDVFVWIPSDLQYTYSQRMEQRNKTKTTT